MIIAIDGPSASGKSTTAKGVAKKLKILHIDTGAMYRAITYVLKNDRIVYKNKKVLSNYLKGVKISFNNQNEVCFNGTCISEEIRSKAVTEMVSSISALGLVRKKMVLSQRKIAKNRDCVLDGRDIGSVVFPDAKYKFFLDANIEDRAKRRFKEFSSHGEKITYQDVINQLKKRDRLDSTRKISPLIRSKDAILIDTSKLTIEQQIERIISFIKS